MIELLGEVLDRENFSPCLFDAVGHLQRRRVKNKTIPERASCTSGVRIPRTLNPKP